jgi:hypothetical protein
MSHRSTSGKTKVARGQAHEEAETAWKHGLGFDPERDQTRIGPRHAQTAYGNNDRRDHEGYSTSDLRPLWRLSQANAELRLHKLQFSQPFSLAAHH